MPPEAEQRIFEALQNNIQTPPAQGQETARQAPLAFTLVPSQNDSFAKEQRITSFSEEPKSEVIQGALGSLDEFLATPMANVNAIGDDFKFKFYDDLNASSGARPGLAVAGVFALSVGAYVAAYRNLRNREKVSHFFYFKRLLECKKRNEILELMGESKFDYELLSAAAHFYSPDASKFVAWKRRFFCYGEKRKELKRLQLFLLEKGKNKKESLDEIFLEIIEKVVVVLNKKNTNSDDVKFERKSGYAIGLTESYRKKVFSEAKELWGEIEIKKSPSLGKAVLGAMGEASFIYWLAVFVFCFIPIGIVGGVAVPPLVIAVGIFLGRVGLIVWRSRKKSTGENDNIQSDEDQKKEIFARKILELNKREAFINYSAGHIPSVNFKKSQLHKELQNALNKRRFGKFHAALQGFLEGCFFPFFAIWVLSDFAKVLLAITVGGSLMGPGMPIAIGIAIATLALGIRYGIYSAIKAVSAQEARYEKLVDKIKYLENANIKIPNLSLQAYDRLLRRYSLEEPLWTRIKKAFSRGWVIIKRLGTGSLVFRLVIWGTITACTIIPAALMAPIAIPFIVGFAAVFAACYYRAYTVDSKLKQTENVIDHLCHTHLMAEKDKLPITATENTVQASALSAPQEMRKVPHSRLEGELSPEQQSNGPVKALPQKTSERVVSSTAQEEKLDRNTQAVDSSPIEKRVYGSRHACGFWASPNADFIRFLDAAEQKQPVRSHLMQTCR
ncbi:MAG: hypothetical protein V4471_03150 [Pseudomonadota bacterium]